MVVDIMLLGLIHGQGKISLQISINVGTFYDITYVLNVLSTSSGITSERILQFVCKAGFTLISINQTCRIEGK